MSEDYNPFNRVDRFKKRRNNTKAITIFGIVGLVFVVILIGVFVLGGEDDDNLAQSAHEDENQERTDDTNEPDSEEVTDEEPSVEVTTPESTTDDEPSDDEPTTNSDEQSEIVKETVSSDDENVIEAYTANWKPIGTSQVGEHEINWSELQDSQDWPEILSASSLATSVYVDDMIAWWVEGDGEEKIIATISDKAQTDTYRVYLSWVDQEGWMPTKVELLKENDKKPLFEDDANDNQSEETEGTETSNVEEQTADQQTSNTTELEVVNE
ncbi:YrrS family protein [Aquibacillus koreensis]|uniref:YrrS family protein n=1 Tax=Aquibacillus koreensis TaxID=279446 RepID=A0A9X3WG03_9BACI|nr:YrrS family protein [Aquibacillus koreensis]MCT2537641.1 YrrS family protein [Aquibacillus koreensis]MDC3419087.1 YrrS family protein [Aquibacillus koreensis]